ncbi:MAG: nickel ABC transporter permease [Thermodesulfobacteriota bacterium]|nr:nickel ABC transporter permease [Thermodesulfobacteriota bacterium]
MARYLLKRLILLFPTVLGVLTLVFLFRPLIPGDPIDFMLGETAQQADRASLRQAFNLDRPLHEQYLIFLEQALHGDLGQSIHARRPVKGMIAERIPATVELTLAAALVAVLIAVPAGVVSALRKDSWVDNGAMLFAMLGVAMPNFWLGPLLIMVFSIHLGWFPVSGHGGLGHLVLPALTLGTAMAAILTRMTRSSMLEVLKEDYITTARAKGLSERVVIWKHAFRNGCIPILTLVGLQLGGLLAGSIITETIFSWPGIGRLTITAIYSRDYPLLQGCVITISFTYILINLLTDLAYAWSDARIRLGR